MASALMAFVQGLVTEQETEKPAVEATPPANDDDVFADSDEEDTSKKESASAERAAPTSLMEVARAQQQSGANSLLEVARQQQQESTKNTLSAIAAQVNDEDEQQRLEQVERAIAVVAQEVKTEQKVKVAAQVSSVLKEAAEAYAGDDFEDDAYDDEPDEHIKEAVQTLVQQQQKQESQKKPPAKKKKVTKRKDSKQKQSVTSTTLKDKLSSFQSKQLTLTQRRLLLAMVTDDKPGSGANQKRGVNMEAINELAKDRERRRLQQQGRNRKAEFAKFDDNKHCCFCPRLKAGGGSREQQHGNSDDDDGGNTKREDFVRRMEASERARKEELRRTREEKIYLARVDKKECPACGNPQSYAEMSQKRKKCPNCGVTYRSRIAWSAIADEFLTRLEKYVDAREQVRTSSSPVSEDERKARRRLTWQEVRDEFLGRIQLDLEHREMSKAGIWKEMTETWTFRPVISRRAQQLNLEPFDERLQRDLENRRQRRRQYERLKLALADPELPKPVISKAANAYVPAATFQERLRADLQRRREREQEAEAQGPRGASRRQLSRAC